MTDHSKEHLGRCQLLVMAAVLLAATLLLVGLLPPQVARGQEQQEQQEQNAAPPAQGTEEAQNKWVLDKDPKGNEYVAGELLVTYEKGAFKKAKDEAPKKVAGKVEKDFPEIEVQHVSVPEVKNERAREARQEALKLKKKVLEQHPDVEAVGYNYVGYATTTTPTDPDYGQQWAPPRINAPLAWDTTRGSSNVRIAILDSGMDMNHPDLTRKVVGQYDFVMDDNDATDDQRPNGHGTLSAGVAAASMNNGQNGAGICPNCSLLVGKVAASDGSVTWARVINGIDWASRNGANVINMSFGGTEGDLALERAINNAWNNGAVVVGAAGNNGTDGSGFYPAAYPNVIAVAATDRYNDRAIYDWASGSYPFGTKKVQASNAGPWVDVAAPGKDIYTTSTAWNSGCACYISGSIPDFWGTSAAAPHVSGLAGLLFAQGTISNAQVRDRIESTARDRNLLTAGRDDEFGHGLIDAQAALSITRQTFEETAPEVVYKGSWTRRYATGAFGGHVNTTTQDGASATFSFRGNSVTWWGFKCPSCSVGYVYVDGSYAGATDLYSPTFQARVPAHTKSWPTSGVHTIKIVAHPNWANTSPRADVDAFTVTRPVS